MAMEQNTLAYLETGTGKTLIAILLLSQCRPLLHSERVCIFLVPSVALVHQVKQRSW